MLIFSVPPTSRGWQDCSVQQVHRVVSRSVITSEYSGPLVPFFYVLATFVHNYTSVILQPFLRSYFLYLPTSRGWQDGPVRLVHVVVHEECVTCVTTYEYGGPLVLFF